jgi:hypothetical protein
MARKYTRSGERWEQAGRIAQMTYIHGPAQRDRMMMQARLNGEKFPRSGDRVNQIKSFMKWKECPVCGNDAGDHDFTTCSEFCSIFGFHLRTAVCLKVAQFEKLKKLYLLASKTLRKERAGNPDVLLSLAKEFTQEMILPK